MLTPSILSAEEIKKYNPRPISSLVKLVQIIIWTIRKGFNAIKDSFTDACRYPYEFVLELQKKLADKHGVSLQSIVITGVQMKLFELQGLQSQIKVVI